MLRSNKIHDNGFYFTFANTYAYNEAVLNNTASITCDFDNLAQLTPLLSQGNILANNNNYVSESFNISAWDLYGSSRLGTRNVDKSFDVIIIAGRSYNWVNNTVTNENIFPTQSISSKKYRLLGAKTFELTNHLGNVISTVSDRKLMVQDAQNIGYVHHYTPEILSIGEQYAFGMSMPGRTFSVEDYRYDMNTQERDATLFEGAFTAEYWEYDSRIGRRWNLDPVSQISISDYACFANNPVWFNDILGDYVDYKNFGDKVKVTFKRIFNKKFRKEFNDNKIKTDMTFIYGKKSGAPSLNDAKAVWSSPEWHSGNNTPVSNIEYSTPGFGSDLADVSPINFKITGYIEKDFGKKKQELYFEFYLPDEKDEQNCYIENSQTLIAKNVKPNTEIKYNNNNYFDKITVPGTTFNKTEKINAGVVRSNSGLGGDLSVTVTSSREHGPKMGVSSGLFTYFTPRKISIPIIKLTIKRN
jgi:putative sterol carrier protein